MLISVIFPIVKMWDFQSISFYVSAKISLEVFQGLQLHKQCKLIRVTYLAHGCGHETMRLRAETFTAVRGWVELHS